MEWQLILNGKIRDVIKSNKCPVFVGQTFFLQTSTENGIEDILHEVIEIIDNKIIIK